MKWLKFLLCITIGLLSLSCAAPPEESSASPDSANYLTTEPPSGTNESNPIDTDSTRMDDNFSIIGTWEGEVDEIRGSQFDEELQENYEEVWKNVKFDVTFDEQEHYTLSVSNLTEEILLMEYTNQFKGFKYQFISKKTKGLYQLIILNKLKADGSDKNYNGTVRVISNNKIEVIMGLDDPNKKIKLILNRKP